jgi:hypothetical protein
MTAAMSANGNGRKTPAEELDRLDALLDRVAKNLDEAVAAAVKETMLAAVKEAVHATGLEVLTNAELRKRPQTPASKPSTPVVIVLANTMRRCWNWLTDAYDTAEPVARTAGNKAMEPVHRCVANGRVKLQELREEVSNKARPGWMLAVALAALANRFRKQFLVALAVGVLVGVAFYVGGREIASVGCGLAGFLVSVPSGAVNRLRRVLPFMVASGS